MKLLFASIILYLMPLCRNLYAQNPLYGSVEQNVYSESLSDSLTLEMDRQNYEKAYEYVLLLELRDSLPASVLHKCADCMVYLEKYYECLSFCSKWEKKYPESNYEYLFTELKGECHFYLENYTEAYEYLHSYENLMNELNFELPRYYSRIYSKTLHKLYKYEEADRVYDLYFKQVFEETGLDISQLYKSKNKSIYGQILYEYAYNSFYMGNEDKGMNLLYHSSRCGHEWSQLDYSHLSKCATVMMDMNIETKTIYEFVKYVQSHDFKYQPDSTKSSNIAESFWSQFLTKNKTYLELEVEMAKKRKRKMLQKALDEISAEKADLEYKLLTQCKPYERSDIEDALVSGLMGSNTRTLTDFRIYPTNELNAFATPFGQIYLTSGLVLKYHFNNSLMLGVCAHELTHLLCKHSLVNLWKQYEKERKNEIIGGIVAGVAAAAQAGAAIYAASNGVSLGQSYYDGAADLSVTLYNSIRDVAFYYQFKYSRELEIEADLIAYRFCEAIGIGGYAYIMALQLLDENDLYMKADRTSDHPTLAHRIAFLKWIYKCEHRCKIEQS